MFVTCFFLSVGEGDDYCRDFNTTQEETFIKRLGLRTISWHVSQT